MSRDRSIAARYGFAFAAVALATILRAALASVLGDGVHLILFYPAVVLGAWFGGLWPGLMSTALGALVVWFAFIPPAYSFRFSDPAVPERN